MKPARAGGAMIRESEFKALKHALRELESNNPEKAGFQYFGEKEAYIRGHKEAIRIISGMIEFREAMGEGRHEREANSVQRRNGARNP